MTKERDVNGIFIDQNPQGQLVVTEIGNVSAPEKIRFILKVKKERGAKGPTIIYGNQ